MDLHLFVSKHLRIKFEGLFGRIIAKHDTIPPCVNTDKYSHIHGYAHSLTGHNFVIGKVGPKFNKDKHPPELLEIASDLGMKLLSPGSSEWYGSHGNLIAPEPSWSAVPDWLSKMSVFLFMNTKDSDPETWCRAVTEAMASGLPVVAENAGGITEQITDMENGMLVGKGNFEEAKAAILVLKTRPKLRRSLGIAAREWVEENASLTALRKKLGPHLLRLLAQ
jgi:glycosyltransferase involved in cell wall biosynthesis